MGRTQSNCIDFLPLQEGLGKSTVTITFLRIMLMRLKFISWKTWCRLGRPALLQSFIWQAGISILLQLLLQERLTWLHLSSGFCLCFLLVQDLICLPDQDLWSAGSRQSFEEPGHLVSISLFQFETEENILLCVPSCFFRNDRESICIKSTLLGNLNTPCTAFSIAGRYDGHRRRYSNLQAGPRWWRRHWEDNFRQKASNRRIWKEVCR